MSGMMNSTAHVTENDFWASFGLQLPPTASIVLLLIWVVEVMVIYPGNKKINL